MTHRNRDRDRDADARPRPEAPWEDSRKQNHMGGQRAETQDSKGSNELRGKFERLVGRSQKSKENTRTASFAHNLSQTELGYRGFALLALRCDGHASSSSQKQLNVSMLSWSRDSRV